LKFISFTVVQVFYYGIIDFWRRHVALFFVFLFYFCFYFGIYTFELSDWLDVLVTYSVSVEIVSVIRQDSVVTWFMCYFLPLD
jgi:hypothetical protein